MEGVFYTRIVVSNGIDEMEIETTIGDALALSTIYKCPIYTTTDIIGSVGVKINDDGSFDSNDKDEDDFEDDDFEDDFDSFIDDGKKERVVSVEDLEILMQNAIDNEEYEIAAELRDRIQKLKNEE